MRTTLDIEKPVMDELKRLQQVEKKPLGQITSGLLAEALKNRQFSKEQSSPPKLSWVTTDMGARIDISDKEALHRVLDARMPGCRDAGTLLSCCTL